MVSGQPAFRRVASLKRFYVPESRFAAICEVIAAEAATAGRRICCCARRPERAVHPGGSDHPEDAISGRPAFPAPVGAGRPPRDRPGRRPDRRCPPGRHERRLPLQHGCGRICGRRCGDSQEIRTSALASPHSWMRAVSCSSGSTSLVSTYRDQRDQSDRRAGDRRVLWQSVVRGRYRLGRAA